MARRIPLHQHLMDYKAISALPDYEEESDTLFNNFTSSSSTSSPANLKVNRRSRSQSPASCRRSTLSSSSSLSTSIEFARKKRQNCASLSPSPILRKNSPPCQSRSTSPLVRNSNSNALGIKSNTSNMGATGTTPKRSTLPTPKNKKPEWNSDLKDRNEYRLSREELLRRKELLVSKHNVLLFPPCASYNNSYSKFQGCC